MNNTTSTLGELRARHDTAHIQVRPIGGQVWWWLDDDGAVSDVDSRIAEYRLMPCPTCGAKP